MIRLSIRTSSVRPTSNNRILVSLASCWLDCVPNKANASIRFVSSFEGVLSQSLKKKKKIHGILIVPDTFLRIWKSL